MSNPAAARNFPVDRGTDVSRLSRQPTGIKRRDVLTGTITSPLLDMIRPGTPVTARDTTEIPAALDLPQVPASEVAAPARPVPLKRPDHKMPAPASPQAPAASDGGDISDWI